MEDARKRRRRKSGKFRAFLLFVTFKVVKPLFNIEGARRGVAAAMSMAGGYGAIPVSTSAPQRRGQRLGLVASVAAVAAVCLLAVVAMKGQTRRTVLHDVQVHNSTRRALRCPALTHHVVA